MESIILYATYVICAVAITGDLASIYFINHIWSYRKHKFIQSRSPTLTYSVLWIFFTLLLLAIANVLIHDFVDFWDTTFFLIINDSIQYGCTFAYATRAWILFYHVEWSYESVNHVWRTQLAEVKANVSVEALRSASVDKDSNVAKDNSFSDASLFWINYRDSLGNWKKVFPMTMGLLFPLVIFLLDILPFVVYHNEINQLQRFYILILRGVNIVCYLVIFVLILILIHRIHKISDKYGIAQELTRITICFAVFIVIGRIVNMILLISVKNVNNNAMMTFISALSSILSILCSLYIASFFVLRRLFNGYAGRDTMKQLGTTKLRKIVSICKCGLDSMKKVKTDADNKPQRLTLNRVLSTQYGFETFTQFLISELSVENILFLVEVKQYKACCRRYHKAEKTPLPIASQTDVMEIMSLGGGNTKKNVGGSALPKFGPQMVASLRPTTTTRSKPNVFQSKSIMNVDYVPSNAMLQSLEPYDYAIYLYHKYVIDGSDLQINIPSKTKKTLTKFLIKTDKSEVILLDDYTDQMFKLYDKAWEQIHTLITSDSYSRFKNTQEFKDLCLRVKEEDVNLKLKLLNNPSISADEFLHQPTPSLLDWEFSKIPMVNAKSTSAHVAIPEDEEINIEEEDLEEEFNKLDTIKDYNAKTKDIMMISISDNDAMKVLSDIPSYKEDDYGDGDQHP